MTAVDPTLWGGLLLGLMSSLHCAAMCGGICAQTMLMLQPRGGLARTLDVALVHGGRASLYMAFGWVMALAGAPLVPQQEALAYRLLQTIASISLIWMGMSLAGFAPRTPALDAGMARVTAAVSAATGVIRRNPVGAPFAMGMVWGASACPMVYAAALSASLLGSPARGALFMLGFALGTLPAVLASGAAMSRLTRGATGPGLRIAAGAALALIGFASLLRPWPQWLGLCVTR